MKKIFNLQVMVLFVILLITAADFFIKVNGFLQLILALVASFLVFNLPLLPDKLKAIPYSKLVLFIINVVVLALTFKHRVFFINIILICYLLWGFITPYLLKFKWLLPAAFMLAFVSVYGTAYLSFSLPVFIVAYYPIYVFGAIVHHKNIIKSTKVWAFALFNLMLSGALLLGVLYKALGKSILDSVLFINIVKSGTLTAVYLPFIAMFLVWFALAANFIFNMLISKFVKGNESFELTDYAKSVYNFVSFFAITGFITLICEYTVRMSLKATITDFLHPNILFNYLVLCGLYLCLIALVGKGISNVILAVFTIFLGIANYIKFNYFDEPFYPWDVYMIKNLFGICKEYLSIPIVVTVVVLFIVSVFLLIRFRTKVGSYLKPRINFILIPFGAALFLLNANVLNDYKLSTQIGIQRSWYIGKAEILANGMFSQNYFYLTDLDKYLNPKPTGYSEKAMQAISEKYADNNEVQASAAGSNVKPNVVVVMSESFWDISKLKDLKFTKDLFENVHKYQKGQLAPPVIGGGTANTEFEALSGMSLYFMNQGIIAYNAYLRTETPSIASVFRDNGYSTTSIHPNNGWFYNRDKVYNYFGFERFVTLDSFDYKTQHKGTHISDDAFVEQILKNLNSSDKPAFIFGVSIENHDPFDNKYANFDVTVQSDRLSESQKNIINGYAQGIYDADQSLGKLIEGIKKSNKPTLLYFFGDHAPRLGSLEGYYKIFDSFGADCNSEKKQGIGELKYYTTPYVSWSNFKETRTFDKIISPTHLSYEILKDAGVNYPSYFNIMPKLKDKYPIMHLKNLELVKADDPLVKDYRLIQYDLLFGNKYLKDKANK